MCPKVLKILLFSLVFFCSMSEAKTRKFVGKVVKIRGVVTQLSPGDKLASRVEEGQRIREESSILTRKKSFVQIRLDDGSLINIGPESKMIVSEMDPKGNGVVDLLKGKVRYDIKQNYEGNKKFFVRSRNAALGVRGTEFETIYNPENKITSLLTYTGEVAMVKTEDNQDHSQTNLKKAKRRVKNVGNKIILEEEPSLKPTSTKDLEEVFKKEKPVLVKRGQFSQTIKKTDNVSLPVKISPVQLNALFVNSEFEEADPNKMKKANVDSSTAQLTIRPVEQEAPPEGVYDPEKKVYAPKSGGFIDRETGLYVPPSSDALFDQKNKVYVASNVGDIDEATGSYVPPFGLDLDAKNGFVAKKLKDDTPPQLVAQVLESKEKMNRTLSRDVVQAVGVAKTSEGSFKPLSNRELISKNVFTLKFLPFTQTYTQEGDQVLGSNREYESESSRDIELALDYASGSRWQPTSSFTFRSVTIPTSQRGSVGQTGTNLTSLNVGLKYSMTSRWNAVSTIGLDQQYFLHHTSDSSTTTSSFKRITIPKLRAGVEGSLIRTGRFSTDIGLLLGTNLGKTSGDHELKAMGMNLTYFARIKYWLSSRYFFTLGLEGSSESYTAEGTTAVYEADVSRSSSGFFATLSTYF